MAQEKEEDTQETEVQEGLDIMAMAGIEKKPVKENSTATMKGSLPVQLYEKDGFNTKTEVKGLLGSVELVADAFRDTLFRQISGGVSVKWKQYAYVFKTLAILELSTQKLEGDSMVEYAFKKISENKK